MVVDGQVFIVAADGGESFVECRLAVFALALGIVIFGCVSIIRVFRRLGVFWIVCLNLQSGVVVHLGVDTLQKLGNGQLHQLRVQ